MCRYASQATQKRHVCPKGKCELDSLWSRSFALHRVFFYLKFDGTHLTLVILKVWIINGQYVVDVYVFEVKLICELLCCNREQRIINTPSYVYREYQIGKGHFFPVECRLSVEKPFPQKNTKYCRLETPTSLWCLLQWTWNWNQNIP